jgi:hypothetical protein
MRTRFNLHPTARAIGIFGAVAALATGVTYAVSLSNQATLEDNTISSATADLKVWDGAAFSPSGPGFTVTGLVPGTGSGQLPFYLQNSSEASMAVTAHVPVLPAAPTGGYGFTGFENLKVTIKGTSPTCAVTDTVVTNLLALNSGDVALPCGPLSAGATGNGGVLATEGNYSASFDIDPAFITPGASHAGVDSFDIVFTGSVQ